MKKLLRYTLPVIALCTFATCTDDESVTAPADPYNGKELISFGGEGKGQASTRAFFNDTKQGFSSETTVYMRIRATDGTNYRYAEATATAEANNTTDSHYSLVGAHSDLTYVAGQERFWDDAFGRESQLSVYAFAIPNRTDATLPTWAKTTWVQVSATNNKNWYTAGAFDKTVTWSVSTAQSSTTMDAQDLAYSNNIQTGGEGGRYTNTYTTDWSTSIGDGYMRWIPKTATPGETSGKFDQGHLIFNHALAWIEINLTEGSNFNNSANTDFVWTNGSPTAVTQNITLKSFNTTGTFDISDGTWSSQSANNITTMDEHSVSHSGGVTTRTLYAFVVPGNDLEAEASNVVEFEIDQGKYYVTGNQIAKAIQDYYDPTTGPGKADPHASDYHTFNEIEAGKHYVVHLTVAKKGIERITAAIEPWETVNSIDADAKNTYPTFTFEDRGTHYGSGDISEFNIYRAAYVAENFIINNTTQDYDNWLTGYTTDGKATKTWQAGSSEWKTDWFWPNNKTAYHFRATGIHDGDASINPVVTQSTNDYFNITSGVISPTGKLSTTALTAEQADAYNAAMTPETDKAAGDELTAEEAAAYNAKMFYEDYIWGAPFKDIDPSAKLTYSTTNGFDGTTPHQISYAIASTESQINMLLFHMTSQIFINVQTTADGSANKVNLYTDDAHKTVVEILRMKSAGTVQMGNGLVEVTSADPVAATTITYTGNENIGSDGVDKVKFSYGLVPQALSRGASETDKIGLRITTPDGNQYVVKDLSTCTATVSTTNLSNPYTSAGGGLYTIDRWYPNYQYTYTITIKKTGIERITAAVQAWETVTGDLGTIDLEN